MCLRGTTVSMWIETVVRYEYTYAANVSARGKILSTYWACPKKCEEERIENFLDPAAHCNIGLIFRLPCIYVETVSHSVFISTELYPILLLDMLKLWGTSSSNRRIGKYSSIPKYQTTQRSRIHFGHVCPPINSLTRYIYHHWTETELYRTRYVTHKERARLCILSLSETHPSGGSYTVYAKFGRLKVLHWQVTYCVRFLPTPSPSPFTGAAMEKCRWSYVLGEYQRYIFPAPTEWVLLAPSNDRTNPKNSRVFSHFW